MASRPVRVLVLVLTPLALAALAACSAHRPPKPARAAASPPVAAAPEVPATPAAGKAGVPAAAVAPGSIRVTVADADGVPIDFAEVRLEGGGASEVQIADENGQLTFTGLKPGEYRVSAVDEGNVSDQVAVVLSASGEDVKVPLKRIESMAQMVEVNVSASELVEVHAVSSDRSIPRRNPRVEDIVSMMPGVVRTGGSDGGRSRGHVGRKDDRSGDSSVSGGLRAAVPTPAVPSFRLITGGASARYGEQSTGVAEIGGRRSGEGYKHLAESAFRSPLDAPLSTFGVDVDTASYAIARSYLDQDALPPPDAVRVEEIVNAFRYDDAPPSGTDAFAATTEVASCPWATDHRLVRIALKGAMPLERDVPPRHLVFLVDVSGSMQQPDKLPLVQQSLKLLVATLRPEDTVGLVVYAGAAGVVLEPTPGSDRATIEGAIDRLSAGGSTAGAEGIRAAYALAERHLEPGAVNRVVLATDGDFNVGVSSEGELVQLIEQERAKGVFLTVLGFGQGNYQDAKMEQLADHGNGNYAYVDTIDEGRRVLVADAAGTLYTIAKDVKVQVEMNPGRVARWRLVGYENRVMADEDFDDDSKDGGEIGAGHSVTALYEIVPVGASVATRKAPKLRYQAIAPTEAAKAGELMTVKLRWKLPDGETSDLLEAAVLDDGASFESASDDLRWSAAAAGFGMLLRRSDHAGSLTWPELEHLASSSLGRDADGRRAEMVTLVQRAARLQPKEIALGR